MNLDTAKKNIAEEQDFLSTKDGDVAVIKSIVEYSNTLKNRCIEYMDTPESEFSYDQLAEMVKAYRIYSRSCGEIVTLIYEFYDYEEVDSCTKTVDITKDNFSAHINAAKAAVTQRLDACHERYSKTFFSEDEFECNKILRRTRAERRTLEELMRLFGRLAKSFEVYFDSVYDEYSYIDDYVNTNGAFSPEDYYYEEEAAAEYPEESGAAGSEVSAEDSETVEAGYETETADEKTSTLEDILAEYSAEEDYDNYYTEGESGDTETEEEAAENNYESAETAADISEPEEIPEIPPVSDAFENDAAEEPAEDNYENTEIIEEAFEDTSEAEETKEIAEDTFENAEAEEEPAEDIIENTEAEEAAENNSDSTEAAEAEAEKYNFEHIERLGEAVEEAEKNAEKTADEKFIDFIENGKFEFLKAVFEENGDIRREAHITTVAESDFTKLPLKNVWNEYRYVADIHNIYRQYTSISSDDTEIRRGIIRAGAVKRISDFLETVGIEPSAENIMQLDKLCPIEFSAPDAAVIDTDSAYILSVFKAVYDYLKGDRTAPIAVNIPEKQDTQGSCAEEKFFGFGSGDDYEDYETSKYIAADYEAAAREFDSEDGGSEENGAVQDTPDAGQTSETNSLDNAAPEKPVYEEYAAEDAEAVPEPEPVTETAPPIEMILNGKEAVYANWSEAERALCEYAIKAKPFAMALINRRSDTLNGQKLFNRATYETPNAISLSNGLQVYKAASKEEFMEICGRVLNICSIDRDIYKIIESGV